MNISRWLRMSKTQTAESNRSGASLRFRPQFLHLDERSLPSSVFFSPGDSVTDGQSATVTDFVPLVRQGEDVPNKEGAPGGNDSTWIDLSRYAHQPTVEVVYSSNHVVSLPLLSQSVGLPRTTATHVKS